MTISGAFAPRIQKWLLLLALGTATSAALAAACPARAPFPEDPPCEDRGPDPLTQEDFLARLEAVSHAINEFAALPQNGALILSVSNRNKPKAEWIHSAVWCEKVLQDVIDLRNIEIVTHVADQGPIWVKEEGYNKKSDSIDPNFSVEHVYGRKLVSGYVNIRWDKKYLLTLRVNGTCSSNGEGHRRCTNLVHSSVWIYGPDEVHSCNASISDRLGWPFWMHKGTIIHLTPRDNPPSRGEPSWVKAGTAEDGKQTPPLFFDYSSIDLKHVKPKAVLRVDYAGPQSLSGLTKQYQTSMTRIDLNCSKTKFEPISRLYLAKDGAYVHANAQQDILKENLSFENREFIQSICFLKQNGFEMPNIAAADEWDAMPSPNPATKISEAKAQRRYKNGYLLVKQRNDLAAIADVNGTPSNVFVLVSAFNCRDQAMNRLMTIAYGPDKEAIGVSFFDSLDNAPRLPENKKRLIDACAEMK